MGIRVAALLLSPVINRLYTTKGLNVIEYSPVDLNRLAAICPPFWRVTLSALASASSREAASAFDGDHAGVRTAADHIVERRPNSTQCLQRPVKAARGPRHRQIGEFHDRPSRCLQSPTFSMSGRCAATASALM